MVGALVHRRRDAPSRNAPTWLFGAAVVAAMILLTFGLRLLIEQFATNVSPFAMIYPGIAVATLLASWRAGLAVLVICQLAAWHFFLPDTRSFQTATVADSTSLALATIAEVVLLWAINGYAVANRRIATAEADRAIAEANRAAQLQLALREVDHRTMNNFQLASAVLRSQQGRDSSAECREALDAAAQKLLVLASVHRKLTYVGSDLSERSLSPLLEEVIEALRGHLIEDKIEISCDLQPIAVPHDCALHVALITNELVTNALKHAFPDGRGRVDVTLEEDRGVIVLTVADDGTGRRPSQSQGSGSRLTDMLAKSMGGQLDFHDGAGTTAKLVVPRRRDL